LSIEPLLEDLGEVDLIGIDIYDWGTVHFGDEAQFQDRYRPGRASWSTRWRLFIASTDNWAVFSIR
jgi:hypothetical protein